MTIDRKLITRPLFLVTILPKLSYWVGPIHYVLYLVIISQISIYSCNVSLNASLQVPTWFSDGPCLTKSDILIVLLICSYDSNSYPCYILSINLTIAQQMLVSQGLCFLLLHFCVCDS